MSCHNIGRGMDSVAKVVAEMYMNTEISKESALRLFHALRAGVHWCDGNEYEATASLSNLLCGRCLKKIEDSEATVDIWDMIDELNGKVLHGKESENELVPKYEKLFKEICDKKGSGYGKSFNGDSVFFQILKDETISDDVCEECFMEILKKYSEEK